MAEPKSDLRLEIAHVLFIDIVGYSKRLIDEQHESLQDLNQIVEAIAEFTKARQLSGGNSESIGSIGYVEALAGDKEKARAVLEELKALSQQRYIPPSNIGLVYCGLGDKDEALSCLEKACDERDPRLTLLKVDPRWDSLRDNARFVAILKRIGLQ